MAGGLGYLYIEGMKFNVLYSEKDGKTTLHVRRGGEDGEHLEKFEYILNQKDEESKRNVELLLAGKSIVLE